MTKSIRPKKKSLKLLVQSMRILTRQAEAEYSIEVEDIIEFGDRDPKRIERLLDLILDFCFDKKVLVLYKKLCHYYFPIDPRATASYIYAYREMWDEESLKPRKGIKK